MVAIVSVFPANALVIVVVPAVVLAVVLAAVFAVVFAAVVFAAAVVLVVVAAAVFAAAVVFADVVLLVLEPQAARDNAMTTVSRSAVAFFMIKPSFPCARCAFFSLKNFINMNVCLSTMNRLYYIPF